MDIDKLIKYCHNGFSVRKIAEAEGKSPNTIRYWLKKYKLRTKYSHNIDIDHLKQIVKESNTRNNILMRLGRNNSSNSYKLLNRLINRHNIDISHLKSEADARRLTYSKKLLSDEEFFIKDSTISRSAVKKRILRNQLIDYICDICGQDEGWRNKKLVLILDHINGIRNDNRIENLRFVCPNCNSQLSTHCRSKSKVE